MQASEHKHTLRIHSKTTQNTHTSTKAFRSSNFEKLGMIRSTRRAGKSETKEEGDREREGEENITSASLELERECIVTQVNVANSRFPQKQGRLPHRLFPPRTGCVWGDNWRVPWHAARERAPHSATRSHTKLGSLTCVYVSVYVKTTDWKRVCVCLHARACVFACVRGCVRVRLSQEEENRGDYSFLCVA